MKSSQIRVSTRGRCAKGRYSLRTSRSHRFLRVRYRRSHSVCRRVVNWYVGPASVGTHWNRIDPAGTHWNCIDPVSAVVVAVVAASVDGHGTLHTTGRILCSDLPNQSDRHATIYSSDTYGSLPFHGRESRACRWIHALGRHHPVLHA